MQTSVTVEIVAAFVDERDGGNLAGVVFDRDDLDEATMQAVATQLALSETVFVRTLDHGFRFDVFSPRQRMTDCGHATVAAFGLLAQRGRFTHSTVKHTPAGPRIIQVDERGRIFMQQPAAQYTPGPDPRTVAASLGLREATAFAYPPTVARNDVAFLLVGLPRSEMLATIVPDARAIEAISTASDVCGYSVFAPAGSGIDALSRMFAPRIGIPEESATGMAAGMLATFLHDRLGRGGPDFTFEQGAFMDPPSPSRLFATLAIADGSVQDVWVGGYARLRTTRTVAIA